jgi:hypothetical protein
MHPPCDSATTAQSIAPKMSKGVAHQALRPDTPHLTLDNVMRHTALCIVFAAHLSLLGCGDAATASGETAPGSDVVDAGPASSDADEGMDSDLEGDTSVEDDSARMTDAGATPGSDAASDNAPQDIDSSVAPEEPPQSSPCGSPLVELQTAKDPTCAGGNVHRWPIGMAPAACHGWRAVDTSGQQHDNSANAIGCGDDGSFTFTQFAGNLDCSGTGVVKTFTADACEQDTPPVLYTKAINLTCCEDLAHPDCATGTPSVTIPGGQTFLDSVLCE